MKFGELKTIVENKLTKSFVDSNLKKDLKIIEVSKKYFRPQEVDYLKGDASKARKILKWKVKKNFYMLVKEMMSEDFNILKKNTNYIKV